MQKHSHRLCEQYNKLGVDDAEERRITVAAGNPCRVIRKITEKDSMYLKAKRN